MSANQIAAVLDQVAVTLFAFLKDALRAESLGDVLRNTHSSHYAILLLDHNPAAGEEGPLAAIPLQEARLKLVLLPI